MTDTRALTDRLAIADVIRQVARAFDEKMHDTLLPQSFTADATIHYHLRGALVDIQVRDDGTRSKRTGDDQPILPTARGRHA